MSEGKYAAGGVIGPLPATVKVRKVGDLTEYWEPAISAYGFRSTRIRKSKSDGRGALDALNREPTE